KMDVVPGRDNAFQADITGGTEGHYIGRCAELCGVDHSRMLFNVEVMPQDEFDEWAQRQEQNAAAAGEADEPADLEEIEEIDEKITAPLTDPRIDGQQTKTPSRKGSLIVRWMTSTDHKSIGYLYLITSFAFFLFGGVLAVLMRLELLTPGMQFMSHDQF